MNNLIKKTLSSAFHSELLKDTSILISGTALAQLIPVFLQPVLRRLYLPEVFGAYSVYISITGIIAIVSSFKYDLAIVLPKKEKVAANVLILSLLFNLAVCLILMLVINIWRDKIMLSLNLQAKFSGFLYIAPAGVFFYSTYQCLNNWLIREKGFIPISINKFVRRGTEGLSQVTFGIFNSSNGIIFGDMIGHISNIISGVIQAKKRKFNLGLFSLVKLKYVAHKYSDFPKYNMIPSFMSACSFLLPTLFLNKFYSTAFTGYFDLSKQLLSLPLALVSTSISNVLLQKLSESFRENKSIKNDLMLVLGVTSLIAAGEIIIISFFGVDLFRFVFGDRYVLSGRISMILVWSYALNFLVGSFSAIFISLRRIRLLSLWQIIYFISILSLAFFRNLDQISFIKVYVFIEIICFLFIIFLMFVTVLRYEKTVIEFRMTDAA